MRHGSRPIERACERPYATRVTFAAVDGGELLAACETSNYVGSVGPGVDPASDRDIRVNVETYLILQNLRGMA